MRTYLLPTLFTTLIILIGCGNDESTELVEEDKLLPPTSVSVKDVGNFNNGLDLEVSFNKPSGLEQVEEFRIFIVPETVAGSFDAQVGMTNSFYMSLTKFKSASYITLLADQKDTEGNLIVEQIPYQVFVLSSATKESGLESALSSPSNTITLQQKNVVRTLTANIPGGSGGMDVDAEGNIYMADFGSALGAGGRPGTKVFRITPDGQFVIFANGLFGASGNDFDADGNLFQSNIGAGTVSKITPDGIATQFATGFSSPVGIVVDRNGDLFVCNCNANTISKVTNGGATVTNFAVSSLLSCPNGIDIDDQGNLYVANFSSSNLVKIAPTGQASVFARMPGNNNGHLLINGSFIYVISRGLHQIHRVSLSNGEVSLFAGTGVHGIVNGSLLEAGFAFPNDLAFSPDGTKMYVNDVNAGNNGNVLTPVVVRVIELVE